MPGDTMTEPNDLITAATPYALHALSDDERDQIDQWLSAGATEQTSSFAQEVRQTRETMAALAASTATEPPARLRARLLKIVVRDARRDIRTTGITRWRAPLVAVAAATAIGLAAAGIGAIMWPPTPTAQQVFTATDVRTVTGAIPTGGTATVVYSRQKNTAVLVMNNVAPPRPGTVYQMWLIGDRGPQSAGTMDAQAVAPSTTAVISRLNGSTALAFTVENGQGSTTPTGTLIAQLPLNY
ncbi:anti-sigma-K factor rskA [Mycobacteroides abscessus 5S-0422]|uniref:Anti-sigma-K factor RskA n=3 Tax=Mycobacteroides abscessus TaxID=36809 RepID=X8DIP4_9MYCO|nr:anti-sigma factor [Mycobacteroides abscessus subsp. massiliense]EIU05372.1 anti-sigma-K factor rskA [Mycobacteroides abscessus 5S-0422]EIU08492.1 anti-sigma-K factor rskA [Mycobacteroides abscessus 5S-0421]EIU11867.1 anti-sigma-K factor rskA [Mycobacteroides abscessus 5S-0304]EIU21698.1 anti-sigma-K factor rskA [Mycobacteroides abscessus 5S-0708]EIU25146.1 anti-sigma-K factor rskA [Mycobacteroides abscessus 5S-0817]EIU31176.1 anti-sigma-K factor rskA [Mycobacteroides abscessus 5S-1212]EIU